LASDSALSAIFAASVKRFHVKGFLRFMLSWRFVMHIALIGIFVVLTIWVTQLWLGSFTRHGKSVDVPDLSGLTIDRLDVVLNNTDLSYEITDSLYSEDFPRGVVIQQNPEPGSAVKRGRTIFLSVNSKLPEMVPMPGLSGKSLRIAIPVLEISGLQLESLQYKPDESCTDCVIGQLYKGQPIKEGTKIRKGEKITLVLGQQSRDRTRVPSLLGFTYTEASELLNSQSLNMGVVLVCSGCNTADDSASAFVINQSPGRNNEVNLGSFIDVFLSTDSTMANDFQTMDDDTTSYENP
jgi:beta-lactam-binding protein with PASTA domain